MLKQNLSIKSKNFVWGSFKPELSIWGPAVPNDMDSGKDVWGVYWPKFGVRGQEGGKHMNRVQFLELFEPVWFYKGNGSTLRPSTCTYPHWFPNHPQSVPISSYGNGKATSTRAVLKQNLSIKSKNFVWGSFKPWTVHFGVLLCLTIWTVAKMFEACIDQKFGVRGQEGGKHMNRVQFLELFEPFWFYKGNGSTLRPSTCTYPHWFPNHPQSVPISSYGNGKATSTRAVLKQTLSIKSKKSLFGGPSNLNCPFWSPAVPNDMDSGKDVWGVYWPKFGVRGQEGGKHMNRVQFLELFDFIEAAFKGTTLNKRTKKKKCFFLGGRAPKRYLKQSRTSLKPSLSIHLSVSLSLPRSLYHIYLSIIFSLSLRCWITSITIALVSCCIGSLLDPFPVGLDKNVDGMRRSVTQQIYLKNLPSIKSGSVGQQIRTIPKNSISIKVRCLGPPWIGHKPHVGLQMVDERPSMKSDF